jgi:hypothetical protein
MQRCGGSGELTSVNSSLRLVTKVLFVANSRPCYRRHIGMGRRPRLWVVTLRIVPAMVVAKCASQRADAGSSNAVQHSNSLASRLVFSCLYSLFLCLFRVTAMVRASQGLSFDRSRVETARQIEKHSTSAQLKVKV